MLLAAVLEVPLLKAAIKPRRLSALGSPGIGCLFLGFLVAKEEGRGDEATRKSLK